MVLRKLLVCVLLLMMVMLTSSFGETNNEHLLPELDVPDQPTQQEGDEEVVETTVGAMRNALFYYKLTPILLDYIDTVKAIAIEEAEKVDVQRQLKEQAQGEAKRWKRRTIYAGSTVIVVAVVATAVLIGR